MYKKFVIPCVMMLVVTMGMSSSVWAGKKAYLQKAELHDFISGAELPGGALLTRDRRAVHVALAAASLDQNAAYSVWWVVFNNPEACTNGVGDCGAPDLMVPEVKAALIHATGFVTGNDGTANVIASLSAGRVPEGTNVVIGSVLKPGNVLGAEIHVFLRTHGPINLGNVTEQIGYFDFPCDHGTGCANQSAYTFPPVVRR